MLRRVRRWFSVTAVRLSIIYTVIFGLLSVGIVIYLVGGTIDILTRQYEESIDTEVQGLARVYRARGITVLIRTLERRSRVPGANLYLVTDPNGRVIGGNVPRIQSGVMDKIGWTHKPFRYFPYEEENSRRDYRAIARVLELPSGIRILVGRDIGEHEGFRRIVRRAFLTALGTMLALGLLTWFFVGRRALKRLNDVSKSSQRIMAGDRSERLPVTGVGDEFDRISTDLNTMLDRINSLDEGLKQMSDNIAHDLKTPITRLRNKAHDALRQIGETGRDEIEDIISDCDQIVKTFDALLMISRVESGSTVARFTEVDLVAILNDMHELYEPVAEESGADLILEINNLETAPVEGNRELISQALTNLIDNAMKYGNSASKPKIEISISGTLELYRIVVADNGSGIDVDDRTKALERFGRLEKSRTKHGNGLGLSLVSAIAKLHNGELVLDNNNPGLKAVLELKGNVIGK